MAAVAAGFLVLLLGRPQTEPLQTLAWHPAEIAAPGSAYQIPKLRNEPIPVRRKVEAPAKPMVVKMFTDDPQIVIYWVTD